MGVGEDQSPAPGGDCGVFVQRNVSRRDARIGQRGGKNVRHLAHADGGAERPGDAAQFVRFFLRLHSAIGVNALRGFADHCARLLPQAFGLVFAEGLPGGRPGCAPQHGERVMPDRQGDAGGNHAYMMAGYVVASIPLLLVFVYGMDYYIDGFASSALRA